MKKKILLLSLSAFAALVMAVCSGCSGETSKNTGPVYLPTHFVISEKQTVTEVDLGYDAEGNITEFKSVTTYTNGGTLFGTDGSTSRYEAGNTSTSMYAIELDSEGFPVSLSYDNTSREGENSTGTYNLAYEKDSKNRLAKVEQMDASGSLAYIFEYTYDDNGNLSELTKTYVPRNGVRTTNYNENGWDTSNEYQTDSSGQVIGSNTMYGDLTFEYDDNGCIVGISKEGQSFATIEYAEITNPSQYARACAHNKISLDVLCFGWPDLRLSPIYP